MGWTEVEANINFWTPAQPWGGSNHGIGSFSPEEQAEIKSILGSWYLNSDTFRTAMDAMAGQPNGIMIAKANAGSFTHASQFYSAWNPANETVHFNLEGELVSGLNVVGLIHELLHQYLRVDDEPLDHSILAQNGANYDFWGPIQRMENQILVEMDLPEQQISAYLMKFTPTFAAVEHGWTVGENYTGGAPIDISRVGDFNNNTLDMRARTDNSRDLIFGDEGDDIIHGGGGNDHLVGDPDMNMNVSGDDRLDGGQGDDRLMGGRGDDTFIGGSGDDEMWGGDAGSGTGSGTDTADYSGVNEAGIFAVFDGSSGNEEIIVSDGEFGIDTLHAIDRIRGTADDDSFQFLGEGTNARIDMTDLDSDGYALAEQNGASVRIKDFENIVGGDALTVFIGNGEVGRDVVFYAGSGGGDFTLKSGNRAWGYDGAVDIFRVTTTVPTEFASYTEAQKLEYLRNNRVFIGNFEEDDQLYVDGVLFDGNKVTSSIAPAMPVAPNNDSHNSAVWLTGNSSWGTVYPQTQHEIRGTNDSSYVYGSSHMFRDVSFQVIDDDDDETTLGLISFDGRTGHAGVNPEDFVLDELAVTNSMLRIVIEDFADGDGDISFTHDTLSQTPFISGLQGNTYVDTPDVTDPMRLPVAIERDVIDGNADGYAYGGGATVDSDDENFNFGDGVSLGDGGVDAYVLGAEELEGTEGADQLSGGPGDDSIDGFGGPDQLAGGTGNDRIDGGDGDDSLDGGDGNDALKGGAGEDAMAGGLGNDTYEVDDGNDVVTELADSGNDTIFTTLATYALGDHVENLFHDGAANFTGTGTAAANQIGGGGGDDILGGGDGDDILFSSLGDDSMDGGDGFDVLSLSGTRYAFDVTRDGSGVITVTEIEGFERTIVATAIEAIHFEQDGATWSLDDLFGYYGTAGDDTLEGSDVDNRMFGLGGNDILLGRGGTDLLDGGTGADAMTGHDGDDTYVVDESGDTVTEAADEGWDSVLSDITYTLGANVEVLELTSGSGAIDGTGNALDNALYGNESANVLIGGGGDDGLDGGGGGDTMVGGQGSDGYYVDDAGDVVTELSGQGTDDVYTTLASYTLAANVERLTGLLDTGQSLTGNGLANLIVGGAGADTIAGGSGSDTVAWYWSGNGVSVDLQAGTTGGDAAGDVLSSIENLTGGWGDDSLSGTSAANILDGGAGLDVLTGRGGHDVYYVDDAGDQVVEASGQGTDEVRTTLAAYAMVANTEVLRFIGEGGFIGTGGDGSDTIHGGADGDVLTGGDGYDSLLGGGGDDELTGGADGDTLDGGLGADEMTGGDGNDNYLVDDALDLVIESSGEGTDQVYTSLLSYVLAGEVENLTGSNYLGQELTGNALANLIWGGTGADTLAGAGGDDELRGNAGDDVLLGGDGADLLVGSSGVDTLTGGAGADTFRISGWDSIAAAPDWITDFVSGVDKIDLAGVDAGFWTGGDQAFTFIGNDAFSAVAGELRYNFNGTNTLIKGDWDGDGAADLVVILSGEVIPLASDFIL